jgi:hypothetical protein
VLFQDAGGQGIGFLLGSLGVTVALTSETCFKGLPRAPTGEVITFKGQLGTVNPCNPTEPKYFQTYNA